jgi:hypothetical protein
MKIQITANCNIRQKATTESKVTGIATTGQLYDTSGLKNGQIVAGVNQWYELTVGGYLWSGNAKEYTKAEITKYSQSDWRWWWKYLGFGGWGQTIGNYGCALTSCAMLCGIDPATLNEYMKRSSGFVSQTLLVWSALERATSGKLVYKGGLGEPYDNNRCLDIIKREKGCIVQVYGSGIPMHFVVAIGGGQIIDPLDGRIKPFSTYTPVQLRDFIRV